MGDEVTKRLNSLIREVANLKESLAHVENELTNTVALMLPARAEGLSLPSSAQELEKPDASPLDEEFHDAHDFVGSPEEEVDLQNVPWPEIRDYTDEERKEEGLFSYEKRLFHPVHIGELYDGKYEVLRKLGHGMYSTVWLVRNKENSQYFAMKVLSGECYGSIKDVFELEILKHLRDKDHAHRGHKYISLLQDDFECEGPNGKHKVLIFKVCGESLFSFSTLFIGSNGPQIPQSIAKRFVKQILLVLDYAHSNGVIHTDLKMQNMMIQIPDESVIGDYFLPSTTDDVSEGGEHLEPWQLKSHNLSGFWLGEGTHDTLEAFADLDIAVCDWGVSSWIDKHLCKMVVPPLLQPPEVMIAAPWSTPVDIWTLGLVMLMMVQGGLELFDGRPNFGENDEGYSDQHHLFEMECCLGRFPLSLVEQCESDEFRELIFDHEGKVKVPEGYEITVPPLEELITNLDGEDRTQFVEMVKAMLKIDPQERKTAKELLEMVWVKDVQL